MEEEGYYGGGYYYDGGGYSSRSYDDGGYGRNSWSYGGRSRPRARRRGRTAAAAAAATGRSRRRQRGNGAAQRRRRLLNQDFSIGAALKEALKREEERARRPSWGYDDDDGYDSERDNADGTPSLREQLSFEEEGEEAGAPSHALRLRLMMGAYRRAKTLGVLENKLLCHTVVKNLGMPAVPVLYGAFAHTALGEWPAYDQKALYAALRRHGLGARRPFVVKPASDGTNYGLLVMEPKRWRRENWTEALVARHVERFLYKEKSSWGSGTSSAASSCRRTTPTTRRRARAGRTAWPSSTCSSSSARRCTSACSRSRRRRAPAASTCCCGRTAPTAACRRARARSRTRPASIRRGT